MQSSFYQSNSGEENEETIAKLDDYQIIYSSFYNLILVSKTDYDKTYAQLLKNALKYGMTRNEFWYGENYRDYFLYEEAYFERLHDTSHIQGQYFYIALSSIASLFNKEKDKQMPYPDKNLLEQGKDREKSKKKTQRLEKMSENEKTQYYYNKLSQCY